MEHFHYILHSNVVDDKHIIMYSTQYLYHNFIIDLHELTANLAENIYFLEKKLLLSMKVFFDQLTTFRILFPPLGRLPSLTLNLSKF